MEFEYFEMISSEQGWSANLIFDRSKYDVRFRSGSFFENLGDKLIYDDIELSINLTTLLYVAGIYLMLIGILCLINDCDIYIGFL